MTEQSAKEPDVWARIAAPIPSDQVQWRIDGKPTARDGKFFARYVAYVDAQFVRERLDSVVPGEWDLTLEVLPCVDVIGKGGEVVGREISFKARLQILGVIREDVGQGDDYKSAASDAFKRAAVRYGVAHELYAFDQNWVEVDGDGKYAKPVVDPQQNYERKHGSGAKQNGTSVKSGDVRAPSLVSMPDRKGPETAPLSPRQQTADVPASTLTAEDAVSCPKCGGRTWDNRLTKRNPKAPDYKCQNRSCDGAIWLKPKSAAAPRTSSQTVDDDDVRGSLTQIDEDEREELPF